MDGKQKCTCSMGAPAICGYCNSFRGKAGDKILSIHTPYLSIISPMLDLQSLIALKRSRSKLPASFQKELRKKLNTKVYIRWIHWSDGRLGCDGCYNQEKNCQCALYMRPRSCAQHCLCTICKLPIDRKLPGHMCTQCALSQIFECKDCSSELRLWELELSYPPGLTTIYEDSRHEIGTHVGGIIRCKGNCRGSHCTYCSKKFGECACVAELESLYEDWHDYHKRLALIDDCTRSCGSSFPDSEHLFHVDVLDGVDMRRFSDAHIVHGDEYRKPQRLVDP